MRKNLAYACAHDSKKNVLKPHLKQTWCMGKLDSRFLARMETLLARYNLPYDPNYPVICYDERPCFLIGETVAPLVMQSGRVRKEHYADEKLGSCALSRQCLKRRIPTIEKLEHEILALVTEPTEQKIKIDWQCSIQTARSKLNSHYVAVQAANEKFKET